MPSNLKWSIGSTIADKFRVLDHLGQGGMGSVLKVEHRFTKYIGALKVINDEFASNAVVVQRFLREASAAGRIGSPHIVEMFDAGITVDGAPYLFMELLHGRSLEEWVATEGQLSVADAIEVAIQAARGLLAAHGAGIIHRDVKPANLFVCPLFVAPSGAGFRVKVLDFGISKFDLPESNPTLTVVGTTMGTLRYMSYEQLLSGNDVDERADVYSLGVVLYECLTGVVPFAADTMVAQSVAITKGEYVPLRRVRSDVPELLEQVLASCLTAQREHRLPDMQTLVALLEQVRTVVPGVLPTAVSVRVVEPVGATAKRDVTAPEPTARASGTPAALADTGSTEAAVASAIASRPKSNTLVPVLVGAVLVLVGGGLATAVWRAPTPVPPEASHHAVSTELVPTKLLGMTSIDGTTATVAVATAAPAGTTVSPVVSLTVSSPSASAPLATVSAVPVVLPRRANTAAQGVNDKQSGGNDNQRRVCARLLQRQSLGELLSEAEQSAFNRDCKK